MRGKAGTDHRKFMRFRITPAYAGKSASESPRKAALQDHPRLCGEKALQSPQNPRSSGSPPPMRGKAFHTKNSLLLIRIPPAYAGKRDFPTVPFLFLWDHPRLCGEKLPRTVQNEPMQGSPPPMRGKGTAGSGGLKNERITPAYAGKSNSETVLPEGN